MWLPPLATVLAFSSLFLLSCLLKDNSIIYWIYALSLFYYTTETILSAFQEKSDRNFDPPTTVLHSDLSTLHPELLVAV